MGNELSHVGAVDAFRDGLDSNAALFALLLEDNKMDGISGEPVQTVDNDLTESPGADKAPELVELGPVKGKPGVDFGERVGDGVIMGKAVFTASVKLGVQRTSVFGLPLGRHPAINRGCCHFIFLVYNQHKYSKEVRR
jgi:hypothetical protein